jgi:hypothetical protein
MSELLPISCVIRPLRVKFSGCLRGNGLWFKQKASLDAWLDRSAEHRSAQTGVSSLRSNAPRSTDHELRHYQVILVLDKILPKANSNLVSK